jgi:hypothetical protein
VEIGKIIRYQERRGIALNVWRALATRNGGEIVDSSDY